MSLKKGLFKIYYEFDDYFNLRFNSLVQIYPKQYSSTKLIKCDMIKTAQNQTCSRSIEWMIQWFDKCSAIIYLN